MTEIGTRPAPKRPGSGHRNGLLLAALAALLHVSCPAPAAILYTEDFNPDANGWGGRDAIMNVTHDAGNFWMQGVFTSQFFPVPQTDAFVIDSGTDFLGNYVTPGITQISFDLVAMNFLPSDLFIRLIDGSKVFSYQFSPVNMSATYVVNLAWSFGWTGTSESDFNTALTSVDALEIQLTRNGMGEQIFRLDNVQTLNTDIGGGGGGGDSVVPEPGTLSLFALALAYVGYHRHRMRKPARPH
jgi:hypothetical protein